MRHARAINREIRMAQAMSSAELYGYAKTLGVPLDLLKKTAELGRLPVVNFAAGGLGEQTHQVSLSSTSFLPHNAGCLFTTVNNHYLNGNTVLSTIYQFLSCGDKVVAYSNQITQSHSLTHLCS